MPVDKELIIKTILVRKLRKRFKRKPREFSIRQVFFNRMNNGESFLVRELRQDPFYHHVYFRMCKDNFDELLSNISDKIMNKKTHACPITPLEKLAITLRYLASGSSQISMALSYRVSPSSICNLVRETMTAICDSIGDTELPPPNAAIWKESENHFSSSWNFPNCCGAIDGKHIRIMAPSRSGSLHFNYKGFFSLVLLAIVDAKYRFVAVDIGASGSQSDGGVLGRSVIGKALLNNQLHIPEAKLVNDTVLPYVIVGDDAFPLRSNLLKPFPGKLLTHERKVFNYRLSRARMVVENSFGILASRWRILHTCINADLELTKLIVKTCVILHNYLMNKGDLNQITPDTIRDGGMVQGNWRDDNGCLNSIQSQGSNNYTMRACEVREKFMTFFNNAGSVSWQNEFI